MRLIMMGTGPFAVPVFQTILTTPHESVALVTAPIRARRGRSAQSVSPMRDMAHAEDVPVFDPENVNSPEAQAMLRGLDGDLLVVCDYGQILSAETLATARLGGINLHGSLLPKYRGAAPINWAIFHGEEETGVSVIHMTPQVDAGPVIAQAHVPIGPEETAVDLEERMAEMGAWLTRRAIDAVESGRLEALPQDPQQASRAPRLKKEHGRVDWSWTARQIRDQIRAMEPWPKTYTFWHRREGDPIRMILGPADVVDRRALAEEDDLAEPTRRRALEAGPGEVILADRGRLIIGTGGEPAEGALAPRALQPAGKRLMPVDVFLRGYRVEVGDRFGPQDE